ncbi:MAG: hypothetical protein HC939_24665 [Pleurocapsa sp. SU_5_0]|nr:hypothetical protein [Pleurocapsa sp. SU_5_0]
MHGLNSNIFTHQLIIDKPLVEEHQQAKLTQPDFYQQVKDAFNLDTEPDFQGMTIRELRAHIKNNQLQEQIRASLGKSVSDARQGELIASLQAL